MSTIFVSGREAARWLDVHPRTVRRLVERGELAGQVVGDRLVISAASVRRLQREREGTDRAAA